MKINGFSIVPAPFRERGIKLVFIMKLTVLLLTLGMMTVSAETLSQNTKVTVNVRNGNLDYLFSQITSQSDYLFFYQDHLLDSHRYPPVNIRLEKAKITEVLDQAFQGRNLTYYISGRQIVILEKESSGMRLQRSVTGRVVDRDSLPLTGVAVAVKGTTQGTATDLEGRFTLESVIENAVLVFSYMGYQTREIPLEGADPLTVVLAEDFEYLEEVVVVGYGEQKKINMIGSVSQITAREIGNRPVTQMMNALTGQMSGVSVIVRSGRPGANDGTIRVRGVGSFGASPDALILIDGIPGNLNDINPEDIQTVSVLKDASSAAIYGARAANGVILVTTKSGTRDHFSLSYNGYAGFNKVTEFPDFVNSWEYAEMYNIATGSNSFTPEEIEKYRSQEDPDHYPNTHFLKELFREDGFQTGHTLSLTGGNGGTSYFLSGGFLRENGIIPRNNYSRYNLRLNMQNDLSRTLKLTTRLSGSFEERNEPQATAIKGGELTNQLIQVSARYPAIYLGQASNGDFGIGPESAGTPVAWLASDSYLVNPRSRFGANLKLDWTPFSFLTLSAIGGYNLALLEQKSFLASQRLNDEVYHEQSYLNQFRDKNSFKTMQFLAEYSRPLGAGHLDLLLGYSFEDEVNSIFTGYRQDFPSNDYTAIGMGGVANQQVGGGDSEWAIQSVFSRLKYDYKEKYLFETTFRYDGSSRFPVSNKYAFFPSMAVGWRASEEPFMKEITWLSNLKLKASWGILGNQNIGNYPYQAVLTPERNYPFGNTVATGAAYWNYKDPNIKWESTETTDIGLETGFLKDRLSFAVTYFRRNTRDILFQPSASVSTVLGLGISETNTGKARNSGWEFDLSHRSRIGPVDLSLAANYSVIKNEVVSLGLGNVEQPNGMVGNGSNLFIGYPMEMYYGYLSDGVFLNDQDITSWADQSAITPQPRPGDIRYRDISGPDGKPDGKVNAAYDRAYLGSRIPKHSFGLHLRLGYGQVDFAAFLQGVAGVRGYLNRYVGFAFFNLGNIQRWQMEGRFDPENPVRYPDYPRLEILHPGTSPNTTMSDFWMLNAAYLRVKNIQLGYSLPESTLQSLKISQFRVYLSVENPLSFHSYRPGWDPEINTGGEYYPLLSKYTLGFNVKF